jgi:hypothetical protein
LGTQHNHFKRCSRRALRLCEKYVFVGFRA